MSLKIVRNDITRMNTEAIVNTAGSTVSVGDGCDRAVYEAAGFEELFSAREKIGEVPEGEVFITSGMKLPAKYIIHAVSPYYIDGESGEEEKLRSCYRKSLELADKEGIKSIAFPLIATGSFGYPKADGLKIALEEINAFLLERDMDVSLVVFDGESTDKAKRLFPLLEQYVSRRYVQDRISNEYRTFSVAASPMSISEDRASGSAVALPKKENEATPNSKRGGGIRKLMENMVSGMPKASSHKSSSIKTSSIKTPSQDDSEQVAMLCQAKYMPMEEANCDEWDLDDYDEDFEESELQERIRHISDPFGVYFLYQVESRGMTSVEVQNGAWITKQVYHKIKKFSDTYHPDKRTALCLSVGLKLNLDETKDFIGRAGYAFSNSILEDVIWQFSIENELDIYDISDLLEKYGFKPIVNF